MTSPQKSVRVFLSLLFALSLVLGFALLPAGCSTGTPSVRQADEAALSALADRVWDFGQAHPDGFTLDVRTMTVPTEGIAVSYAATQNSHSREALDGVIRHALRHDGHVGG